ncbi:hypothetical protein J6590_078760 [Homalodisca vitripennis]|nr:hypothetical protein J6590_078760 [Homalodisca vitripennis]
MTLSRLLVHSLVVLVNYRAVPDDAEHTFFRCPRWEWPRLEVTRKLGVFSVDTVCEKIMEDEGNWDCLSQFVRGILLEKKPDLDREVAQIP